MSISLRKTYRHSFRIALDPKLRVADKLLFFIHRLYFVLRDVRILRITKLASLLRISILGYVYTLNYSRRGMGTFEPSFQQLHGEEGGNGASQVLRPVRKHILVTRAMGGIGDLLMMTPGLHELKRKHPRHKIHLAIPRRYFPLFQGNEDVTLLDIEKDKFDCMLYKKWYNFTDCPAARVESRTAPRVKKSRVKIFARALGLDALRMWRMDSRPRYFISDADVAFCNSFWTRHGLFGKTVIGVQLKSDEVYRNYPHMEQLVQRLGKTCHVLVFDGETIAGFEGPGVTKVAGLGLRQAFALAGGCNAIVAPDSSFVHFAGDMDIPCVALFGPIDGRIRTRHYTNCKFLDVRTKLGCLPCWRNDRIPCKLTNLRTSVCMADISVEEILGAVSEVLSRRNE